MTHLQEKVYTTLHHKLHYSLNQKLNTNGTLSESTITTDSQIDEFAGVIVSLASPISNIRIAEIAELGREEEIEKLPTEKQKQLEEASKAQILLGSYGMASEGLDIPTLNTLIMTTPRREVEQSVGRIIRKKGKIQPLIIDIVDMLPSLSRQGNHRRKLYKKLKYNIKLYDVENNNIMTETDLTNNKDIKIENGIVDFIDD